MLVFYLGTFPTSCSGLNLQITRFILKTMVKKNYRVPIFPCIGRYTFCSQKRKALEFSCISRSSSFVKIKLCETIAHKYNIWSVSMKLFFNWSFRNLQSFYRSSSSPNSFSNSCGSNLWEYFLSTHKLFCYPIYLTHSTLVLPILWHIAWTSNQS